MSGAAGHNEMSETRTREQKGARLTGRAEVALRSGRERPGHVLESFLAGGLLPLRNRGDAVPGPPG